MKSTEPDLQLKSPIQRNYNRAVFYTYIGVIVMALLSAWVLFDRQKVQLIEQREEQVARHVLQIDLLLESSIRAVKSLRNVAVDHLRLGELARKDMLPEYEKFNQDGQFFTLEPSYANGGEPFTNMGRITGSGSLKNRSDKFYQELEMLFELSLSFPVAKEAAPKASSIYYISNQRIMSSYPWSANEQGFREELLNKNQFRLATPEMNPQRSVFWSQAYVDVSEQGLLTTLGLPVYLENEFIGSINLDMTLSSLAKQIRMYFKMPGTVILLDQQNNILSHSDFDSTEMNRVYHISQRIPSELHSLAESEIFDAHEGVLRNGYYIHSVALHNAPWRLLYLQEESALFQDAWDKLQLTFLLVVLALSVLVTIVHWQTRRAFVSPASRLLTHLEVCSQSPIKPPHKITSGWEPWFQLVSRIFEENKQYTLHLAEQNKRLDNLVAKRTQRLRETTERREREYALLRSLIDSIPEAIVFKDQEGKYLGCNKSAEHMLGYSESEMIGMTSVELTSPEQGARIRLEDSQVLKDRAALRYQEKVDISGKSVLLDILKLPFYNRRGELLGLISVWRDVTREYQSAEQLRLSEERYHLAMDAVEDGLWDWYLDSEQIICNPSYYSMLGYETNEFPALISSIEELIHPDDRDRVKTYRDLYLSEPSGAYETEFRMRTKSGRYLWVLSRGRVVEFTADGMPSRMLGTHKDITRQKSNEVALLEAKHDAELANMYKSEFLANMSHEIRTPMNAIIGMLQLASRTQLTLQQQDYLNKAGFSAESLLRIINDILDFSKIEAGKLELESVPFSLEKVLDHVIDMNALSAQEKGVELLLFSPLTTGLTLKGDPLRLGQVLVNLLSNAVKFTQDGEIELGCEDVGERDTQISLKFWVRDTGIGISREQQANLFDAFSQADGSTTRQYGGTGLGLSISKHLVSMMGGNLSVESEPQQGSTFSFTLSFDIAKELPQQPLVVPKQLNNLTSLVVDDNPSALQIYSTLLRDFSFGVNTATGGAEAIERLLQQDIDLLLLDWMMPVVSGGMVIKAVDEMIADGRLKKRPVIIIMTAYSTEPLNLELDKYEYQAVLQKPFKASSLFDEIIGAFAAPAKIKQEIAEQVEPQPLQSGLILLVEDNFINQQVASELLKSAGYDVVIADNGQIALDLVAKQEFDAVLMDIQMPVMDGLTAAKILRETYSTQQLPIIAMTAHAMSGDKEKSLNAGMNAHITKPIVLTELFETLAYWIALKNQG
ncbi:multi-sensor hybrid histidine kinase [Shewanella denitrificans OS217]|uniref:Sensory/regulatory protein RpfC n=1 Tax=Shewanella denitrificans (strain OS217 / ATCC BAA-1090 / DSM 15013) TaxID=318161 RepID=Q12RU6_SHEDO|nr:response regulator [Shewanella denitrificans]ABE53830.1 multi-sensor hybrid histidine kinase [Shewanella denitrificans OS217]